MTAEIWTDIFYNFHIISKKIQQFKVAVSRDFSFLAFFPRIQPTWTPNKQAERVLLKDSFSRRYSRNM